MNKMSTKKKERKQTNNPQPKIANNDLSLYKCKHKKTQ